MEEGRRTISSQGSTQATSMRPPRSEAGGSSLIFNSHVWTYFSREITSESDRFKAHCLLCIENGRQQAPFVHAKGSDTGTLDHHLVKYHGISKQSHERGEAHEGSQQSQLGGYMTSSPGRGMTFSYNKERMIDDFATFVTLDELPFSFDESPNMLMDTSSESSTEEQVQL